jgi:hypothetical protein
MAFGSASNIYITQNGSPSGNCTSNVLTPAFFNNAANWGSGSGQIGPGTTVLLCGTITFPANSSGLTVQGSGASGNPVTIKFDTNAILQSPAFAGTWNTSGGGIDIERVSYVTVDGNNLTGIVQNTQNGSPSVTCSNGSACAYQNSSYGIKIRAANNITVQNLTITSIYNQLRRPGFVVHRQSREPIPPISVSMAPAHRPQARTYVITGNYLAKSRTGVGATFAATNISGLEIANNTFNDHGWHMTIQGANANVATNVLIHGNDISNFADWAAPWASDYHTRWHHHIHRQHASGTPDVSRPTSTTTTSMGASTVLTRSDCLRLLLRTGRRCLEYGERILPRIFNNVFDTPE